MTLTVLDIALPVGLGAVFGLFRFSGYRRAQLEDAASRAALDAIKGVAGLGLIIFAINYLSTS